MDKLQKGVVVASIIFVIFIGGLFFYYVKINNNTSIQPPLNNTPVLKPKLQEGIIVTKSEKDNVYTYKGLITVPTPCNVVTTNVSVLESYPEQVIVDIVISTYLDVCAQVISEKEFIATFEASKEHTIRFNLNGEPIETKITEESFLGNTNFDSIELIP